MRGSEASYHCNCERVFRPAAWLQHYWYMYQCECSETWPKTSRLSWLHRRLVDPTQEHLKQLWNVLTHPFTFWARRSLLQNMCPIPQAQGTKQGGNEMCGERPGRMQVSLGKGSHPSVFWGWRCHILPGTFPWHGIWLLKSKVLLPGRFSS